MSYENMGRRVLDYEICAYDGSRLRFRGPKHDLSKPYVAFLGTTETFGKFIAEPFPELAAAHLPADAVNLGMVNGGVDAYLNDPAVLDVARGADLRVVQIMGALNLSNHYFKVHPRRNDRLICPSEALRKLFPEVDFAQFHFTKAMLASLQRRSTNRYKLVCQELQDIWLARMAMLLKLLGHGTVLMWLAGKPPELDAIQTPSDPMLIDADMVTRLRALASAYVEVVPDRDALRHGTKGMHFGVMDEPAAAQMMGPEAHHQAAQALQEPCRALLE